MAMLFGVGLATITANAASPAGVKEFFVSGKWTVPTGVSHVLVTMWGAGGGGAQSNGTYHFGGGGGGGAYTSTVVAVTSGTTYTITVGKGGTAGVNPGDNGTNGGTSRFALGSTILVRAGGGQGGFGATTNGPGAPGAGGKADGTAQISHAGGSGLFADDQNDLTYGGDAYASNLSPEPPGVLAPNQFSAPAVELVFRSRKFGWGGFPDQCGGGAPLNGNAGYVLLSF